MSVSEFIEENIGLPLPDLLVKYHHYRSKKYPSDLDIWTKAQGLSQKDFCKWFTYYSQKASGKPSE